jgi:two-component system chemotaxis response regulator CheY
VGVLLRATDRLRELIRNPGASNQADISGIKAALVGLSASAREEPDGGLRMLLVEDDFSSRLVLQTFLARHGECHVAVNGREAVEAFRTSLERGQRYHLICMDIMMPEMDGREAVRQIRAMEEARGILSTSGAKIIMTTAVDDIKEVIRCFQELCDAYLVKPIELSKLLDCMRSFQLVQPAETPATVS